MSDIGESACVRLRERWCARAMKGVINGRGGSKHWGRAWRRGRERERSKGGGNASQRRGGRKG